MSIARATLLALTAILLCGCKYMPWHPFQHLSSLDCHKRQDYQHARQLPPIKVPPGLDAPNTQSALSIPPVDEAPPAPGPHDPCLDLPPKYKPAPPPKGLSG
jgi:uncharacterized lipoprotein